jgi:hypothetical protein
VLLALPQMYGVGYPVLFKAVAGDYALWFLLVLAAGKVVACSLTLGIGGSGGVFAPSLFDGATSGMVFGIVAQQRFGPGAGPPAMYAVVAMGAVFASAGRAPLTSVASVLELTGDYTLTLPVMPAVAIALSRALSYRTIYTTRLLRRGTDIDRAAPWHACADPAAGGHCAITVPGPLPARVRLVLHSAVHARAAQLAVRQDGWLLPRDRTMPYPAGASGWRPAGSAGPTREGGPVHVSVRLGRQYRSGCGRTHHRPALRSRLFPDVTARIGRMPQLR